MIIFSVSKEILACMLEGKISNRPARLFPMSGRNRSVEMKDQSPVSWFKGGVGHRSFQTAWEKAEWPAFWNSDSCSKRWENQQTKVCLSVCLKCFWLGFCLFVCFLFISPDLSVSFVFWCSAVGWLGSKCSFIISPNIWKKFILRI